MDPSACSNHPSAAERGHLDVVRYLCELPPDRGVDPSADGNYAVRYAAEKGHLNIVWYLCDLPFSRGVARVLSEQPTPCRFGSDGNAARAWSLLPRSAFGDLRQQALASSARLPLLMLRALVRQHRATRNGRKVQSSRERSATCLDIAMQDAVRTDKAWSLRWRQRCLCITRVASLV